jgi:hypothetical protein
MYRSSGIVSYNTPCRVCRDVQKLISRWKDIRRGTKYIAVGFPYSVQTPHSSFCGHGVTLLEDILVVGFTLTRTA